LWNPLAVAIPFAYLAYSAYVAGFPAGRTAGAAFVGLWFGLSAFDAASGHRWLDWLYSGEAEPPGCEVVDAEPAAALDATRKAEPRH